MEARTRGVLSLDPRTKLILLVGVNIFVFTNRHRAAEMLVVAGVLLLMLLCGVYRAAAKGLVLYTGLWVVQELLLPHSPPFLLNSLNIVVITCRKLLPCVCLGTLLVQTTPIRLLMHALQKWHVPQSVIIPLAITIRYFPTLREEQQAIRDAMRLRSIRGPIRSLTCMAVPLMMSASSAADELGEAITARGIDNPAPKSCYTELRFHWPDAALCGLSAVLAALALVL